MKWRAVPAMARSLTGRLRNTGRASARQSTIVFAAPAVTRFIETAPLLVG